MDITGAFAGTSYSRSSAWYLRVQTQSDAIDIALLRLTGSLEPWQE
jgi:hypothetical protein